MRIPIPSLLLVTILGVGAVPISASADVIPPAEAACQSSTAGASCTLESSSGQCVASTCSRLDYTRWDGGGSGPPTTTYDCLVCEVGGDTGSGGCAISPAAAGGSLLALALGLLALVLGARRRRAPR